MLPDIKKQIEYWSNGALDNIETAEILIEKGKRLEGLFFCHLALEKALKAHVTKATEGPPPKTHNLQRLAEIAGLVLEEDDYRFLGEMMEYQIEGRYPEMAPKIPDKKKTAHYFKKSREVAEWLNGLL